jgi:hypothetical protein
MPASDHPSVCTLDCPDTCSLTVTVEDGRIAALKAKADNEQAIAANTRTLVVGPYRTRFRKGIGEPAPSRSARMNGYAKSLAMDLSPLYPQRRFQGAC